jgi:hypothetical protein
MLSEAAASIDLPAREHLRRRWTLRWKVHV